MSTPNNVVIVGAALAGLRTAEALRDGGYDGQLTLIGDEKHAPYDRPPLSKQVLRGWVSPWETTLPRLRAVSAVWRLGTAATRLDRARRRIELSDGETVTYDRLVIATGSRARLWPIPAQAALRGVHLLRTPEDASALLADLESRPSHVLIIGAGFTGSEVASACLERDLPVTVVEANAAPMIASFGAFLGGFFAEKQRQAGVDLRCGVTVTGLTGDADGRIVAAHLSDGAMIPADVAVVCLGVTKDGAWLDGSDLAAGPLGCVCDSECRAMDRSGNAVEDVFLCGDVARFRHPLSDGQLVSLEHWGAAVDQARIVAANLLRPGSATLDAFLPRFWTMQFGMGIKSSGLPACGDQVAILQGSVERGRFVAGFGRKGRMVGVVAVNQARWVPFYEALITSGGQFPPTHRVVDPPEDGSPRLAGFPEPNTVARVRADLI